MKRSRSVRAYVVHLVIATMLPLLAFGAFLLIRSAHNEQQAIATTADERAQGAAADLDRELRNLQDLISILATSHYLLVGDFAVLHPGDTPLLKDGAVDLIVRDLSGHPALNTCIADGDALYVNKALDNVEYTVNDARPHISDLMAEPMNGEPLITINLPVRRENKPTYILSLCALPRISQVLAEQHLPDDWTATVVDRQGRTIASTPQSVGAGFTAEVGNPAAAISAADKGSIVNLWGLFGPAYKASSPVDLAGWTVAISVPRDAFFGPVRRSLLVLLVAGGGTLALVLVLAVNIGRRIAGPITDLTGIARALGDGGQVAPPHTGIHEADLVARALCSTNEDLRRRTEELTQTVGALRHSEKRLRKLSDDLRRALDERTELLNRMVSAQESERRRIARELHDHLGQYFAAMLLGLDAVDKAWRRHEGHHQGIAELQAMTSEASKEVHQLSWELRPTALDDLGLEAAMANYLEKWSERFNLDADFVGNLQGRRLAAPIEITLYRVLQEGMTNIAKHANARKISVVLDADAADVRLVIEDDGTGFDREESGIPKRPPNGFGLLGMRERLALVGGSLIIETAPNRGTALFCRIPA